ncbi:MAG: hypothetical protein KAX40_10790, partial [Herpetosiphon sp.]|nr:hypothetical protein [Herpetosiphon sp.]
MNPLVLAWLPLLVFGGIADLKHERWWRLSLTLLIALVMLSSNFLLITAGSLIVLALINKHDWQTWLGVLLIALASLVLGVASQAWRWSDSALGAQFGIVSQMLVMLGVIAVLAGQASTLTKLSAFVPFLRSFTLVPFDWRVLFVGMLVAFGILFWQAWGVFCTLPEPVEGKHRSSIGMMIALIAGLIASEAGITALWLVALATSIWQIQPRSFGAIILMLVSLWLTQAALLAGGIPMFATLMWLIMPIMVITFIRTPQSAFNLRSASFELLCFTLIVSLPKMLELLVKPLWQMVGAGLTPFGRVQLQPWIGMSVRNAGSETVATLSSVVLAGLLIAAWALSYA